jgi:hypothetical protein
MEEGSPQWGVLSLAGQAVQRMQRPVRRCERPWWPWEHGKRLQKVQPRRDQHGGHEG